MDCSIATTAEKMQIKIFKIIFPRKFSGYSHFGKNGNFRT